MDNAKQRVAYLVGAGASHGSARAVGSAYGILMGDLAAELHEAVRVVVAKDYSGDRGIARLVNGVIDETTDFEHLITFLDNSPSARHRRLADEFRRIFEQVLKGRLALIEGDLGDARTDLYAALLDMHRVPGCRDELVGVLTLNYDDYIERAAIQSLETNVDFGVAVHGYSTSGTLKLLKLHGSFAWADVWPITKGDSEPLWIPPGIQKTKDRYPFNVLWGLARELLHCDVLRVIGCRLTANDWDLISLLFTTRHSITNRDPYSIEIIDAPLHAAALKKQFPYLEVRSLLEIEPIGRQLVSEFGGGEPREYASLSEDERIRVMKNAGLSQNWFQVWLTQMAEAMYTDLGSLDTTFGKFAELLAAPR